MSVKTFCEMTGVSRSGYYAWLRTAPSRNLRKLHNRDDFELILAAYKMHGYSKGAKGIYMAILHMGPPVVMNLKKIRRLMVKFNLSGPSRGPNPTDGWPGLLRQAVSQTTYFNGNSRHTDHGSSC